MLLLVSGVSGLQFQRESALGQKWTQGASACMSVGAILADLAFSHSSRLDRELQPWALQSVPSSSERDRES
jgi:hypothetical protein